MITGLSTNTKKVIRKVVPLEEQLKQLSIQQPPDDANAASATEPTHTTIKASSTTKKVVRKVIKPAATIFANEDNEVMMQDAEQLATQVEPPVKSKKIKYDDCTVCCSPYTAYKRKQTACSYCGYDACTECLQRYLLSSADAHCMNCKKAWNKEYLKQCFSKVFVREYLPNHHTDVLLQLEKSLFPDTLRAIEAETDLNTSILNSQ